MEFEDLLPDDKAFLSLHEFKEVSDLITKGRALIKKLATAHTFEELKELIKYYAGSVNFRRQLIERIIDKNIKKRRLNLQVNALIRNTEELIITLRALSNVEEGFKSMKAKLNKMLDDYGLSINLDYSIKYWTNKTVIKRKEIILGFDDLSIPRLLELLLKANEQSLKKGFLMTDLDIINAGIVVEFLNSVNDEELRLAIKEDPEHTDFLLKTYILVRQQARRIKSLAKTINDKSLAENESELRSNIFLINKELKKLASDIKQSMQVLSEARRLRVKTQHLVGVYGQTELMNDPKKVIKSFLKSMFKVDELIEQLMYEYLVANDLIPESLERFTEFSNRSQLVLVRSFFLK